MDAPLLASRAPRSPNPVLTVESTKVGDMGLLTTMHDVDEGVDDVVDEAERIRAAPRGVRWVTTVGTLGGASDSNERERGGDHRRTEDVSSSQRHVPHEQLTMETASRAVGMRMVRQANDFLLVPGSPVRGLGALFTVFAAKNERPIPRRMLIFRV